MVPEMDYLFLNFWPVGFHIPQLLQAIASTLGYLPEPDDKSLSWKRLHARVTAEIIWYLVGSSIPAQYLS